MGNQLLLEPVLEGGSGEEIPLPLSPPALAFLSCTHWGNSNNSPACKGAEEVPPSGAEKTAEKSGAWI